jgi:hypothetical protein
MTTIHPLIHLGPDNLVRRWFVVRTTVQPDGFILHLACPVWRDEILAAWKLGSELWPNVIEIRTATQQEVDAHWQRLEPAIVPAPSFPQEPQQPQQEGGKTQND